MTEERPQQKGEVMLIGKKYKLESDTLNIILSERKMRKKKSTGENYENWEVLGYFATIPNALHELVNYKIRASQLTDLKTISNEIDELHQMIASLPIVKTSTSPIGAS